MEIVDRSLFESSFSEYEVKRCIEIGLLCVQDQAADRPTMSAVIKMLGNDSTLAAPKHPAFIFKRTTIHDRSDPSTSEGNNSVNGLSITVMEAR